MGNVLNTDFVMIGLTESSQEEFVKIFLAKHPKVNKEEFITELDDSPILKYHNRGFIFEIGPFSTAGFNFGKFVCSFNIDSEYDIVADGENEYKTNFTIHPNIHQMATDLKLPILDAYNRAMQVCLGDAHDLYMNCIKHGLITSAIECITNTLNNLEFGEGTWDQLEGVPLCEDCGDPLTLERAESSSYCECCEDN